MTQSIIGGRFSAVSCVAGYPSNSAVQLNRPLAWTSSVMRPVTTVPGAIASQCVVNIKSFWPPTQKLASPQALVLPRAGDGPIEAQAARYDDPAHPAAR